MKKKKTECCVCQRVQKTLNYETLTLTAEEKKALEASGLKPAPDILVYCKPCWGIVNNKERGGQFLRGLWEVSLRRAGVVNAEATAKKFLDDLLAKAKT